MKRILVLCFAAMLAGQVWADTSFTVSGFTYKVTDAEKHEVTFSRYRGSNSYIKIPATVTYDDITYTVTTIGPGAIFSTDLIKLTIAEGVTTIDNDACSNCPNLKIVTIPNTVTSIGSNAFWVCSSLETVTIGNGVTSIGEHAFGDCTSLTEISIPNGVTSIGERAFSDCKNLESITIGSSVKSIGEDAFYGCNKLVKAEYASIESLCQIVFDDSYGGGYSHPFLQSYMNNYHQTLHLFINGSEVRTLEIPNSVTSINAKTFYGCNGLLSVKIPGTVTSIGYSAFMDCTNLSVTIPNSVTSIESRAFYGVKNINYADYNGVKIDDNGFIYADAAKTQLIRYLGTATNITVPNSVTSIAEGAFLNCSGLTSVTIPNPVTSIAKGAFNGCSSLESISLPFVGDKPHEPTDTYQYPFGYIFGTESYDGGMETTQSYYGNSTSSTTSSKYYIPSSLKSVTIIGSSHIPYGAFENCECLTSVNIGCSVTSIASTAFYYCSKLTNINVENGNTSYSSEDGVLFNKNKTTLVLCLAGKTGTYAIPNSVTNIGNYAFAGCNGLTSVTIPNSVASIGDRTFSSCSGLTSVTIPNSVTSIGHYEFLNCSSLTSIAIPVSVTSIDSWAFAGCNGLTSVTIPNSVTSIGGCAFASCSGLTSVTIPNSVTDISNDAFTYCSNATIYCEVESKPENWGASWTNRSADYIKWGCKVLNLDVNNIEHGSATAAGYEVQATDGSMWYLNNAQVTLTATPNEGCHVIWEDNSTDNVRTFTATESKTYTATLEEHSEDVIAAVAATCTETGLTEGLHCSTCGVVFVAQEEVAVLGHNYGAPTYEWGDGNLTCTATKICANNNEHIVTETANATSEKTVAATCEAVGTKTFTAEFADEDFATQQTTEEIAATGHKEVVDAAVAATCTAAGKTEGKHCEVCNAVLVAQAEIPALGHDFKTYTFDNNATTEADGTETALCEHGCGTTDTRTAAGTKIATTPEKGTAVAESTANAVCIYTSNNTIVVENATTEIRVYDAMGRMICRDAINRVRAEIPVNTTGLYIVRVGNVAKRVMINE